MKPPHKMVHFVDMERQLAICIGAQKAGTTWLFRCLQEHPNIAISPGKEIHFFSNKYDENAIENYLNDFETEDDNTQVLLDISTSYLSCAECPERIHRHFPDAKVIAILRDPAERSFSHYLHYKSTKRLRNESLREAVDKYPEILENSQYEKYLLIYRKYFSEDQLLVIVYNEMKEAPQETLNRICDFLSIAHFTPTALNTQYHSTQARANPLYHKLVKVYQKLKRSKIGNMLLKILKSIGISAVTFDKIMKTTAQKKEKLSEKDRVFLEKSLKK